MCMLICILDDIHIVITCFFKSFIPPDQNFIQFMSIKIARSPSARVSVSFNIQQNRQSTEEHQPFLIIMLFRHKILDMNKSNTSFHFDTSVKIFRYRAYGRPVRMIDCVTNVTPYQQYSIHVTPHSRPCHALVCKHLISTTLVITVSNYLSNRLQLSCPGYKPKH